MLICAQSLLYFPVDYVPQIGRRFTVSPEMKPNVTWIYTASQVLRVHKDLLLD